MLNNYAVALFTFEYNKYTFTEVKSREERNSQFFAEDQSLLDNVATDSWLIESNEATANYWQIDEQRQDSVLLQLEEPEDRMKLAMEREHQIGSIVQSIADLKHIFKVRYMQNFTSMYCNE